MQGSIQMALRDFHSDILQAPWIFLVCIQIYVHASKALYPSTIPVLWKQTILSAYNLYNLRQSTGSTDSTWERLPNLSPTFHSHCHHPSPDPHNLSLSPAISS